VAEQGQLKKNVEEMSTFLASKKKEFGQVRDGETCSICIAAFVENDDVVELSCSDAHIFHVDCLLGWLE
jgi:hypothetical protein